jgi:predicted NACHT family NTPase
LLILGAPGTGKTTLLLALAQELVTRAAHDPDHPIPVVFPLSTWAERRRPLMDWLVDELVARYDAPRTIAQAWHDH